MLAYLILSLPVEEYLGMMEQLTVSTCAYMLKTMPPAGLSFGSKSDWDNSTML